MAVSQISGPANKIVHCIMVTINTFRKTALALPGVTEQPHFEKPSFRAAKKIFATLDVKNKIACLKLPPAEQDVFSVFDKTIIYPVPNKWGSQGWTFIHLQKVRKQMLVDALTTAFLQVAPKKLAVLITGDAVDKQE